MDAIIVILLLVVLGVLVYLLWTRGQTAQDTQGMLLLQQRIQELERTLENKLGEGTSRMFESMRAQFDQSQKLVRSIEERVSSQLLEVTRGVAQTQESTKQVFGIAEQLKNLEKVLTHQKQRGNWGEASLQLILDNIFGASGAYQMQYQFPDGETVDAAIFTKEGIIPVDAKFSLDNYNRLSNAIDERERAQLEEEFKKNLKLRIDETSKYVRPRDGTLPFAFMYIPAEAIYYDLLVNEVGAVKVNTRNLIEYAYRDKKVIIVSPTTFAAYLISVANGLQAFKIEEHSKEIRKNVENLSRHLKAYEEYYKRIGSALSTTVGHYNAGSKELGKIDKDVLRITDEPAGLESPLLEKPRLAVDE